MDNETPKPQPPKPQPPKKSAVKPVEKPPFRRRDHLTQRPFNNPQLMSLRDGLMRNIRIKKMG